MITIKIYNDFCYISGQINPEIIEACTLTQNYWYKRKFLLKDFADSKYHINHLKHDFRYKKLIEEAELQNKQYAIPLSSKIKHKTALNIVYINFPEQKKKIYFDYRNNSFPTGWLFSRVLATCKKNNIKYLLEDKREKIVPNPITVMLPHSLRDYQLEAYFAAIEKERGILSIATGAGKTLISAKILSYYGASSLYLVPSLNLVYQTHDVLKKIFGEDIVGFVGDGDFNPKLFTVATQQTIWSRVDSKEVLELFDNTKILILDEAHKVEKTKANLDRLGNTWYLIALKCYNARIRIALTATPGKSGAYGRLLLEAVTGKIIYELGSSELIKREYLAKPIIHIYTIPLETKFGNWQTAYKHNIFYNDDRNNLIVKQALKLARSGKRVLIVTDRIEHHGQVLLEKFSKHSEPVKSLYGTDKSKIRLDVLEDFKQGKIKILISTLIKEGVDLPEMDAIILANAGKGGVGGRKTIQTIGRCLRKTEEKNQAVIIDFYDDDGGTLTRHSKERLKIYQSEPEFDIQIH